MSETHEAPDPCLNCGSWNLRVNYHHNRQDLVDPNGIESVDCLDCGHHEGYYSLTKRAQSCLEFLLPTNEGKI